MISHNNSTDKGPTFGKSIFNELQTIKPTPKISVILEKIKLIINFFLKASKKHN